MPFVSLAFVIASSGIIFVIRNGLRWRDAHVDHGPPKTIDYRSIRQGLDRCSASN